MTTISLTRTETNLPQEAVADGGRLHPAPTLTPSSPTTSVGRLTLNVLLSFAQYGREVTGYLALGTAEQRSERSVRMTLSPALLFSRIVQALVEARLPRGIGLRHLCELPPGWDARERILAL